MVKGAWQVFDLGASVDSHPSDACILAKINGQRKCAVWQTVHWCLALLDGMGPRDARNIRTKEMNAPARTMAAAHRSTVATFRNNRRMMVSHNAIVILHSHKQRKRDNANNTSVMMANVSSRHNGIVISRSRAQVFVTKRNISSAYLSHKLSLSVPSGSPDTDTDHDHGLIRIRIMIGRRYEYGSRSKNLLGGASRENRAGGKIRP